MKIQVMTFTLKGQLYGFDISTLDEIIPMIAIKPLLELPSFLEGIINLRGEMIPVVDLGKQFGITRTAYLKSSRIVIATFLSRKVGFIVDDVKDIVEVNDDNMQPTVISEEHEECVENVLRVNDDLVIHLISTHKILKISDLEKLSTLKIGEVE